MKKKIIKSKREIRIITISGIIVLFLMTILCLKAISKKEDSVMHYSDNSQLDYNVFLKENDFYTTPSLPKDRLYVSTLIDYIDAKFNYNFHVVEDLNLGYKYSISAKVEVQGDSNKNIFEKEEILVSEQDVEKVLNKQFSISENVKIDYDRYNELASSFINEYGITAKANIIVSLFVDVVGTHDKFDKKMNDSAVVSFVIPLANKTTEIKMNYDLTNNSNVVFEYGKTSITHPFLFVFAILIAIGDIAYVCYQMVHYLIIRDGKVRYQEKLKKIFRDYGRYISKKSMTAHTKEIMYTVSLRTEIVRTFDDLINVRDSIQKPILFYESVPGEQAIFYIIDTKVSYIYIMSARDLDKKNNNFKIINYSLEEKKELPSSK